MLNNGQETRCWYKENSPVPCAMRTPCGDEFRYEYDDAYRLSVIASEFGERSFGYDSLDHIVSDTDALGNSYTAEFDLMGNLRRECSPKEKVGDEPHYWRYAYDAMDRLTSETVTDHISGQKNTTNFAYDKAGNDWVQHYNWMSGLNIVMKWLEEKEG